MILNESHSDVLAAITPRDTATSICALAGLLGVEAGSLILGQGEVVILPVASCAGNSGALLFSPLSNEVRTHLCNSNIPASIYNDGKQRSYLSSNSPDIVLPRLLFTDSSTVVVTLNILSRWLDEIWAGRDQDEHGSLIQLELIELDCKKTVKRWSKIEGTEDSVSRILEDEAILRAKEQVREQRCRSNSHP